MRKNKPYKPFLLAAGWLFSGLVMASGSGTLAPVVVSLANGGQANIAVSNTDPNLFTVVAVSALNLLTSDVAAAAGLLVTGLAVWLVSLTGKSQPRFWPADFFPIFYTCHLAVLGVLVM
ncbi:hypothetical protein HG838_004261 [Salmonella enterica]|nr:hypothetical protein [Salmonella enterica subsp. enterica serovar Sundsvall]ECD4833555.1 hypothetical protein [Salmonella enterica subsp. enterica serovar Sundsvall]EGG9255306.1 hypothetical protein [Salmonella enterica]EGQ6781119.1 hypothetical protein [Salmonella enterica]HAK8817487.1 hypothetical protein [Salmonella enterica]